MKLQQKNLFFFLFGLLYYQSTKTVTIFCMTHCGLDKQCDCSSRNRAQLHILEINDDGLIMFDFVGFSISSDAFFVRGLF